MKATKEEKTVSIDAEWKHIHSHKKDTYCIVTPNIWGGPFGKRSKWNSAKFPNERAAEQSLENTLKRDSVYCWESTRKYAKIMTLKEFEDNYKHDKIEITPDFYEIHKYKSNRINDYYIPVIEKFNALYEGLDFTGIITRQSGIWFY